MTELQERDRRDRHNRFRFWKKVLRFIPRRAALHRYPFFGRFASVARKRSYLWSFRTPQLRPAFYAGSILSFMPVMGVQLPMAFVLALLFRANFMVLGGLQFITNPITAVPIYTATYQVGKQVIIASGFGQSVPVSNHADEAKPQPAPNPHPTLEEELGQIHWGHRIGTTINALVIGGALIGTILGALLDLSWNWLSHRYGPKLLRPREASPSTRPRDPPK